MRIIGLLIAFGCVACGGGGDTPVQLEIVAIDAAPRAGDAATFRVRVLDDDGVLQTQFRGTVRLESSDAAAVFGASRTFGADDSGEALVVVGFRTAGDQTVVVTRGENEATATVRVGAGEARVFRIDVPDPQPSGKGRAMTGAVTATALDAFGNVAGDFSAAVDPVTVSIEPGAVSVAGLAGPAADALVGADDFVDGVARLDGRAVLDGVADGVRLVLATDGGVDGESELFSIVPVGPIAGPSARLLDIDRDGAVSAGDRLLIAFDEPIFVSGANATDVPLTDSGDSLGADALVERGVKDHELQVTLGVGASLRPEGLASALRFASSTAIVSAATGAPIEHGEPADIAPFVVPGPFNFNGAANIRGVAGGDFDGDGDLDLVLAPFGSAARVLLNDGAAHYTEDARIPISGSQGRVAVGDLDGDGDLDLVFALVATAEIWKNDGEAHFTFERLLRSPPNVSFSVLTDVVLGDFESDGDLDIVLTTDDTQSAVFMHYAPGIFIFSDLVGSGYCERAAIRDVDNDGLADIILATVVAGPNGVETNARDEIWRNDGIGTDGTYKFSKLTEYGEVQRTWGLAAGDLDGDGDVDIVAGDQDDIRVYQNDGDGSSWTLVATLDTRTFPFEVRLIDLDGDGHLDVASTRGFWMNDGDGKTFRFMGELDPLPIGRGSLIFGDVDGDGRLDVVTVNANSPEAIYFGSWIRD